MADRPSVILSALADEGANSRRPEEQLAVMAALGLQYYTPRSFNFGNGSKNIMALEAWELAYLLRLHADYGMRVASLGSPIGKIKIKDADDGTTNRYVPFQRYLNTEVERAIYLARALDTKLIRGFSFYPPRGENPEDYVSVAAAMVNEIAGKCADHGLVYGLEVEANIVGCNARLLQKLREPMDRKDLVFVFDAGNLSTQNMPGNQVLAEFIAMLPCMGWVHIKDYQIDPALEWKGHVDEGRLKNFVPCDQGDSGHRVILDALAGSLPEMDARMRALGAPGVFLDVEPHLKGGGQFGGFSGPDGMGVAIRALCRVLDQVGIGYHLRDFADVKAARGY